MNSINKIKVRTTTSRVTALLCYFVTLLPCTASAQSLQFYYNGQPVADGTTVTIEAEPDYFGDLACATNPIGSDKEGLILKNLTSRSVSGTAHLVIREGTMQPTGIQWCMGGSCVPISTTTYDKDFSVPAESSIATEFDATPKAYGEMTARIQVEANLQTATVFVRFVNPDPAQPLHFMRRTLVEEYTGTWCDNCPRGTVGMERLQEDFGDRCIVVHAHVGTDPMALDIYNEILGGGGVPCAFIDRGSVTNPYAGSGTRGIHHYGIDVDVAERLVQPTEAGLELSAAWDEMQRDVVFTATTTFNINSSDAPYRLVFLLMENGLTGEGKSWAQANNCSPDAGSARVTTYTDDDMAYWNQAPYYVTDMVYNHVPVNTKGAKDGIVGSIQAPIVSGQPQTYTDKVTTFRQSVIQDKEKLYALAVLLNTQTGQVVNAAQADIQDYDASGIETIENSHSILHASQNYVYDLQGRKLSTLNSQLSTLKMGIYIAGGRKIVIR